MWITKRKSEKGGNINKNIGKRGKYMGGRYEKWQWRKTKQYKKAIKRHSLLRTGILCSPTPSSRLVLCSLFGEREEGTEVPPIGEVQTGQTRNERGPTLPFTLQWDSNHGCYGVDFLLIFFICWPSNIVRIGPVVKSNLSAETMDWPLGYAFHQSCFAGPMRVEGIFSRKCLGICL